MQALLVIVLPMLISALSSVLGKSVSEFNALPRSERPAKLRAVLRSKWMWTNPPAAVAARALAATDAGVNAAVNALEKHGAGAVALGTEAAHAAAEKHLAKNPRSGGRMARVRIAPSIPTYALDRLDVTRARRNGAHVSPDTLSTLNVGDRFVIRDEDSPDRDSLPYTVTYRKFDDVKAETVTGGSVKLFADGATVAIQGGRGTRTVYSIRRVNGARKNGYSRRRNCGGDCACAPCQAAARSNPDPFAAVRRAIEKEVARFVTAPASGGSFGQGKLMAAAYRVYDKRMSTTGEQLPIEDVTAEIDAARTRAEGLRREHNKQATHAAEQAYRDEMRGRSAYMNPATRRNHHIRVGGTFYTPGGRKGTVLAEARGGYYRVRWSDGTLGSVQDSEMAAYPAEGSRARTNGKSDYYATVVDMAGNEHMVGPMDMRAAQDRVRVAEVQSAFRRRNGGLGYALAGVAGFVGGTYAEASFGLSKYFTQGGKATAQVVRSGKLPPMPKFSTAAPKSAAFEPSDRLAKMLRDFYALEDKKKRVPFAQAAKREAMEDRLDAMWSEIESLEAQEKAGFRSNPATAKGKIGIGSTVSDDYGTYKVVTLLSGGAFEVVPFPYTGKGTYPPVLVKKGRALRANPRKNPAHPEYVLWGLPRGETDALYQKILYTQGKTLADVERIKGAASLDGWHTFRVQTLDLSQPFNAGAAFAASVRKNGRKTFRVRFHSAVGQGSRLKQVVERWGGKVGGGGVATFYGADDAEHAMRQAENWGIAGEAIK